MFTGLVQCLGDVLAKRDLGADARFVIRPRAPFSDPAEGESVSVNGVCLTAESFRQGAFTAYASAETGAASTLGSLLPGQAVNLDRAQALDGRLGGHLVSGHVDCVAHVASLAKSGSSTRFRITFPPAFARQVAAKGSVALDGVSLTVNRCGDDFLEVNIIPETIAATVIASWRAGTAVNMETDVIAKHIERLMQCRPAGGAPGAGTPQRSAGLTEDFLRENGF
jgi:riboflavin synthase